VIPQEGFDGTAKAPGVRADVRYWRMEGVFSIIEEERFRTDAITPMCDKESLMPLYEYSCQKCHTVIEEIQKFSDPPLEVCQKCKGPLVRLMGKPALQFKGSGFYITDYVKKSGNSGEGAPKSGDTAASPAPASAAPATPAASAPAAPAAPSAPASGGGSSSD